MQLIGFVENIDSKVIEYLPQSEQMKDIRQRRILFFNMYNFYVDKELRFDKNEYNKNKNIKSIFITKIDRLLEKFTNHKITKGFKVDIASTKIINGYINGCSVLTVKNPKLKLAKLINLIYKGGSYELMMDLDDMFLTLVYERIKKVNKGSKVVLDDKKIIIYDKNKDVSPTLVIPTYKTIENKNMRKDITVNKNINIAMNHLRGEDIRQVFLVYPKSSGFTKHVDLKFENNIKLEHDEYRVKMIPYSFSFCIRKNRCRATKH